MRFPKNQPNIEYRAETPTEGCDLTEWLNRKASESWVLLAVDRGNYIFGRLEFGFWKDNPAGELMRMPLGENA